MVQNKYEASAQLGQWAESKFHLDAIENGLLVFIPAHSYPYVDCVVSNGQRLFRVQVKAAMPSSSHPGGRQTRYRFCTGTRSGQHFDKGKFDVLATLAADQLAWAFFESHEVHGVRFMGYPVSRERLGSQAWRGRDWSIFSPSGSHQPAHQLTIPLLQPSP